LIKIREKNNKHSSKFNLRVLLSSFIKTLRQKYLVFLFFVALSTLAWYIRALGDNYITDVRYPVNFTNLPPNCSLSRPAPEYMNLHISADGFTILGFKLRQKKILILDLNSFTVRPVTPDSIIAYIPTKKFFHRLTSELIEPYKNLQILDISPDTLQLFLTNLKTKILPVVVRIHENKGICDLRHMLSGPPYSIPSKIKVTGPFTLIDSIKWIETKPLNLTNLADTFEKFVPLEKINENLKYSVNTVKVVIPVDKFSESQIEVPVSYFKLPDSVSLKIFPKNVLIKYKVVVSKSDSISARLFKPFIRCNSIGENPDPGLKVYIDSLPTYVQVLKISPEKVEYLIENVSVNTRTNRGNR
jgi:hypothetical protein